MVRQLVASIFNPMWSFNLDEIPKELKDFSEKIFKQIDSFIGKCNRKENSVLCVINAPFRVGKTEFEYTCYRKIINGNKFVLYGTLEELFNCKNIEGKKIFEIYKEENKNENLDFKTFLQKIIQSQLELIKRLINLIESNSNYIEIIKDKIILLPEIERYINEEDLERYFKDISNICNIPYEKLINNIKNSTFKDTAFIIDEMEPKYDEIIKYFKTDFQEPFRTLADEINKGSFPFVLMAFGLKSIYEMAGFRGDVTGRILSDRIPILTVNHFPFDDDERYKNFYWWLSRGRIGWYKKIKQDFRIENKELGEIIEFYTDNTIEKISWIDFNQIDNFYEKYYNKELKKLFKDSLLYLHPKEIKYDDLLKKPSQFKLYEFYFQEAKNIEDLMDISDVKEIFMNCFKDIFTPDKIKSISLELQSEELSEVNTNFFTKIEKYLSIILKAVSIQDKICFGFINNDNEPKSKAMFLKDYFIIPLLEIIHNLIWDYEISDKKTNIHLSILNKIIKNREIINLFNKFNSKIQQIEYKSTDEKDLLYGQLNLNIIHKIFPRPFFSPIIDFEDTLNKQEELFKKNYDEFIKSINILPIIINDHVHLRDKDTTLNYFIIFLNSIEDIKN
ncbi:MAG: hypothetical protein ACTSU2_06935, partial [Promethearchaeota archaeon]